MNEESNSIIIFYINLYMNYIIIQKNFSKFFFEGKKQDFKELSQLNNYYFLMKFHEKIFIRNKK